MPPHQVEAKLPKDNFFFSHKLSWPERLLPEEKEATKGQAGTAFMYINTSGRFFLKISVQEAVSSNCRTLLNASYLLLRLLCWETTLGCVCTSSSNARALHTKLSVRVHSKTKTCLKIHLSRSPSSVVSHTNSSKWFK